MPYDAHHRIRTTRQQQVKQHGHTKEKDAEHTDGYLGQLGHFYETARPISSVVVSGKISSKKAEAICAMPEVERLIRAAALYEAERARLGMRVAALSKRIDELTNPNMRRVPRG